GANGQRAVAAQTDHSLAGLLLNLADTIFELETMLGDIARRQRGLDGAELADQSRTRLLIDRAPRGPVVLRQRRDRPTQQLLVIRHWLLGTHYDSAVF